MSQPQLKVTANQHAALLVIELMEATLQQAANQVGGYLKLKKEADVLVDALATLDRGKQQLVRDWSTAVQLAAPSDVPVIPSLERVR